MRVLSKLFVLLCICSVCWAQGSGPAPPLDSTRIADGALSIDDINWRPEWYNFTEVYGRPRALDDSITLLDNVFDSSWNTFLLWDIAGNYTGTSNDTFIVKGHSLPEGGVIDSLQIFYRVSTDADIIDIYFQGPNVGDFNHTDSTYWTNSVNLSSNTWDTAHYDFSTEGADVTIADGATFGLGFITQFDAPVSDDDTVMIEWIRVRITR